LRRKKKEIGILFLREKRVPLREKLQNPPLSKRGRRAFPSKKSLQQRNRTLETAVAPWKRKICATREAIFPAGIAGKGKHGVLREKKNGGQQGEGGPRFAEPEKKPKSKDAK